jgi:hypothetical protein
MLDAMSRIAYIITTVLVTMIPSPELSGKRLTHVLIESLQISKSLKKENFSNVRDRPTLIACIEDVLHVALIQKIITSVPTTLEYMNESPKKRRTRHLQLSYETLSSCLG